MIHPTICSKKIPKKIFWTKRSSYHAINPSRQSATLASLPKHMTPSVSHMILIGQYLSRGITIWSIQMLSRSWLKQSMICRTTTLSLTNFFDDIALKRLIDPGIMQDNLKDDVFGRILDASAAYWPTRLFNEIVAECLLESDFEPTRRHRVLRNVGWIQSGNLYWEIILNFYLGWIFWATFTQKSNFRPWLNGDSDRG